MKNWAIEEEELLRLFVQEGMNSVQIANELDSTEYQVYKKRKLMGLVNSKVKTKKYSNLYAGSDDEIRIKLIDLMRSAPRVSTDYFNSKESDVPVAATYKKYFGSWDNALLAAGISKSKCSLKEHLDTTVYLVDFGDFYKIGITQQSIQRRLDRRYPPYEVILQIVTSLKEAKELESTWLLNVEKYKYRPSNFPSEGRGYTECFKVD